MFLLFQFVSQLNDILKGVKEAKANVELKLSQQKKIWEELMGRKQELVTQHQHYFALVNKIQDLIKKNQSLSDKMDQMRV